MSESAHSVFQTNELFFMILEQCNIHTITTCRAVSRQWCRSIDSLCRVERFLERPPTRHIRNLAWKYEPEGNILDPKWYTSESDESDDSDDPDDSHGSDNKDSQPPPTIAEQASSALNLLERMAQWANLEYLPSFVGEIIEEPNSVAWPKNLATIVRLHPALSARLAEPIPERRPFPPTDTKGRPFDSKMVFVEDWLHDESNIGWTGQVECDKYYIREIFSLSRDNIFTQYPVGITHLLDMFICQPPPDFLIISVRVSGVLVPRSFAIRGKDLKFGIVLEKFFARIQIIREEDGWPADWRRRATITMGLVNCIVDWSGYADEYYRR